MRTQAVIFFHIVFAISSVCKCNHFLWFEDMPPLDDPCTMIKIGGKKHDLTCNHLPVTCNDHGGFVHFANFDKTNLFLFVDLERKQEFELCLTGGSAERTHIWFDYARRHWQPMAHDAWFGMAVRKDACKKSINGSMTLFFEAPWWYVNWVAYATWNITLIDDYEPKPWPPVGAQDNPYKDIDPEIFIPESIKEKYAKEKEEAEKLNKKRKKKKKRKSRSGENGAKSGENGWKSQEGEKAEEDDELQKEIKERREKLKKNKPKPAIITNM